MTAFRGVSLSRLSQGGQPFLFRFCTLIRFDIACCESGVLSRSEAKENPLFSSEKSLGESNSEQLLGRKHGF
jgi:hypothetical protein